MILQQKRKKGWRSKADKEKESININLKPVKDPESNINNDSNVHIKADQEENKEINDKIKYKFIPKKNKNNKTEKKYTFNKIKKEQIIDEFTIKKDFDFDKNNIQYSWEEENYITEYALKRNTNNYIYL